VSGSLFPTVQSGFPAFRSGDILPVLRPASFRGVPFYCEEGGGTHGRRHADHEYAGRNVPFAEDLGRRQRVFPITGYIMGPLFRVQRNALIAASEDEGVGELVHPAFGILNVVLRTISWVESREARGRCVVTLEFAEAGEADAPSGQPNTDMLLEGAADDLGRASGEAFTGAEPGSGTSPSGSAPRTYAPSSVGLPVTPGGFFDVNHSLTYVSDYAKIDVQALARVLERLRMPASGYDQAPVAEAIHILFNDGPDLVYDPPALAKMVADTFAAFSNGEDPETVATAMLYIANRYVAGAKSSDLGVVTLAYVPQYAASTRLTINQRCWQALVRQNALREFGYACPAIEIGSYEQGLALMDRVNEAFDDAERVASEGGYDHVFASLITLRHRINANIESRNAGNAPLVLYKTNRNENSIVLAWRLYHDPQRDLELVDAARCRTPCFMPLTARVKAA
jgi:DNA circularisation protein N-terminus